MKLTPQEAALYFGQECQYEGLNGLFKAKVGPAILYELQQDEYNTDVKLLLRPLASITEEEAMEMFDKMGWDTEYFAKRESILVGIDTGAAHIGKYVQLLLSYGFDLFNLIEQGKALDKTAAQR